MSSDVKKVTHDLREQIQNISKLANDAQAEISKQFEDTKQSLAMAKNFAVDVGSAGRELRDVLGMKTNDPPTEESQPSSEPSPPSSKRPFLSRS